MSETQGGGKSGRWGKAALCQDSALEVGAVLEGHCAAARAAPGVRPSRGAPAVGAGGEGAADEPKPLHEREGKVNRWVGAPSEWQSGLSTYGQVIYENVRPGLDVVFDTRKHGLEYTLRLKPGADSTNLRFRYEGAYGVQVGA